MTTTTFILFALWCCCCCCCSSFAVPLPDRRLRQADRVAVDPAAPDRAVANPATPDRAVANPAAPDRIAADTAVSDQPFDPSLDALADAKYDDSDNDDRKKRQLSFVQGKLLNFLKPLPVVDVTKEEEKYGNDGDKFSRIGRGFIDGVETVSNMLTSALSFPVDTAKKLSRSATELLNNLGGRLIGLQ